MNSREFQIFKFFLILEIDCIKEVLGKPNLVFWLAEKL